MVQKMAAVGKEEKAVGWKGSAGAAPILGGGGSMLYHESNCGSEVANTSIPLRTDSVASQR